MATSVKKGQMTQLTAELRSLKQAVAMGASSSKRKPTRKQRKAKGTLLVREGRTSFTDLPVARGYTSTRSAYFSTKSLPKHREFGTGITVTGCEVALNVVTAAAAADFFTGNVATAVTVNILQISPDSFNGRLALVARTYTRFRFRSVKFHFVPALGTANPGLACMAYVDDGNAGGFATLNFASISQSDPSIIFSLNAPATLNALNYKGEEAYWTENDSASNAGVRQTTQGELIGFPSSNTLGVLNQGIIWVEYVCELYGPSVDYGFSMELKDREEM